MQCSTCRNLLPEIAGKTNDRVLYDEIMQHITCCESCAKAHKEYNEIADALTPSKLVHAGDLLKQNIMNQIDKTENNPTSDFKSKKSFFQSGWSKVAAIAAVFLIVFGVLTLLKPQMVNNQASAAQSLLQKSLNSLTDIKSVIMYIKVRGIQGDNFDNIDLKGDYIKHTLWKVFGSQEKWKIEKPGLTVVMDGKKQYRYLENSGVGLVGSPDAGFVDWMKIFLNPQLILQTEKNFTDKNDGSYTIKNDGEETILTVTSHASGNFKNPYMFNKSISESNSKRVYHFNNANNRLLAVQVYVVDENHETEVLKIDEIKYDVDIDPSVFEIKLPENTHWVDLRETQPESAEAITVKTAEDAAKIWFQALSDKDWETAFKFDPLLKKSSRLNEFKQVMGGIKIIKLGKSFKSGNYVGFFVPYEIVLPSGENVTGNLSLRNDNPAKAWKFDGGL